MVAGKIERRGRSGLKDDVDRVVRTPAGFPAMRPTLNKGIRSPMPLFPIGLTT